MEGFTLENQDFRIIKDKIIKTNELLVLYHEKNEKLTKATHAFKHLKVNYESALQEINRFKIDNERLTYMLDQLKPKYELTTQELVNLKVEYGKVEERYQQHLIESQLVTSELQEKMKQCTCETNLLTLSPSKKKTADDKVRELKRLCSDLKDVEHTLRVENNALLRKNKMLESKLNAQPKKESLSRELEIVREKLIEAENTLKSQSNIQQSIEYLREEHKDEIDVLNKEIEKLSVDRHKLRDLEIECRTLKAKLYEKIPKCDSSSQTEYISDLSVQMKEKTGGCHKDDEADNIIIEEENDVEDCYMSAIFKEMIFPETVLSPMNVSSGSAESPVSPSFELLTPLDNSQDNPTGCIVPNIIVTPPTPCIENNHQFSLLSDTTENESETGKISIRNKPAIQKVVCHDDSAIKSPLLEGYYNDEATKKETILTPEDEDKSGLNFENELSTMNHCSMNETPFKECIPYEVFTISKQEEFKTCLENNLAPSKDADNSFLTIKVNESETCPLTSEFEVSASNDSKEIIPDGTSNVPEQVEIQSPEAKDNIYSEYNLGNIAITKENVLGAAKMNENAIDSLASSESFANNESTQDITFVSEDSSKIIDSNESFNVVNFLLTNDSSFADNLLENDLSTTEISNCLLTSSEPKSKNIVLEANLTSSNSKIQSILCLEDKFVKTEEDAKNKQLQVCNQEITQDIDLLVPMTVCEKVQSNKLAEEELSQPATKVNSNDKLCRKPTLERRRKFWMPYFNHFVKTRHKSKKKLKTQKEIPSQPQNDPIINALRTLQENKINFTISNESLPVIQSCNSYSLVPVTKPESENNLELEMDCWSKVCTKSHSIMVLSKSFCSDEEPVLLGFSSVKKKTPLATDKITINSRVPQQQPDLHDMFLQVLTSLKEFTQANKTKKRRSHKINSSTSEFISETEPELAQLFSPDVLRRNRKLLKAAKLQNFESTHESITGSESEVMIDSGLVTATPKNDSDDNQSSQSFTPLQKELVDLSETGRSSEKGMSNIPLMCVQENNYFKVPQSVNKCQDEDSNDLYKIHFCPVMISPLASSTKSSPEDNKLLTLGNFPIGSCIKPSLCQKISFGDSSNNEETKQDNIAKVDEIEHNNRPLEDVDISINSSCLNCSLDNINLSQLEVTLPPEETLKEELAKEEKPIKRKRGRPRKSEVVRTRMNLRKRTKTDSISRDVVNVLEMKNSNSIENGDHENDENLGEKTEIRSPMKSIISDSYECIVDERINTFSMDDSHGGIENFSENNQSKLLSDISKEVLESERNKEPKSLDDEQICFNSLDTSEKIKNPTENDKESTNKKSIGGTKKGDVFYSVSEEGSKMDPGDFAKNKQENISIGNPDSSEKSIYTNCNNDLKEKWSRSFSGIKSDPEASKFEIGIPTDSNDHAIKAHFNDINELLGNNSCDQSHFVQSEVKGIHTNLVKGSEEANSKSESISSTKRARKLPKKFEDHVYYVEDVKKEKTTKDGFTMKKLRPASRKRYIYSSDSDVEDELKKTKRITRSYRNSNEAHTELFSFENSNALNASNQSNVPEVLEKKVQKIKSKEFIFESDSEGSIKNSSKPIKNNDRLDSRIVSSDNISNSMNESIMKSDIDNSPLNNDIQVSSKKDTLPQTPSINDLFGEWSDSDNSDTVPVVPANKKATIKKGQSLKNKILKQVKGLIYGNKGCDNSSCDATKAKLPNKKINIVQDVLITKGRTVDLLRSNAPQTYARRRKILEDKHSIAEQTPVDILAQVMQGMTKTGPQRLKPKPVSHQATPNLQFTPEVEVLNKLGDGDRESYSDCPRSPDVIEVPDRVPKLIPTEKPEMLPPSKVVSLMNKLMLYSRDEQVLDEVTREFAFQNDRFIANVILEKLRCDIHDKANMAFPPSPPMTDTQRILLGFLTKLEKTTHPGISNTFLSAAEMYLFRQNNRTLLTIQPVTRLYTAICKMNKDLNRIRRFVGESFYFAGDHAVPILFTALVMWPIILPMESQLSSYPMAKVIVQLCYLKPCNTPGYNLLPLRDLLHKYYGYPSERWNCDQVFQEVLVDYIRNPSIRLSDFTLLLFLRNKPAKWSFHKIKTNLMPLYQFIPDSNANLKAHLLILLGNICRSLIKCEGYEYSMIVEVDSWLQKVAQEDKSTIVRQAVCLALSRLPKKPKSNKAAKKTSTINKGKTVKNSVLNSEPSEITTKSLVDTDNNLEDYEEPHIAFEDDKSRLSAQLPCESLSLGSDLSEIEF